MSFSFGSSSSPGALTKEELDDAVSKITDSIKSADDQLPHVPATLLWNGLLLAARRRRLDLITEWERSRFKLDNPLRDTLRETNWISHDNEQWASTGLIEQYWWADYFDRCSGCNCDDPDSIGDALRWRLAGTLMFFCNTCKNQYLIGKREEILLMCPGAEITCDL